MKVFHTDKEGLLPEMIETLGAIEEGVQQRVGQSDTRVCC